MTAACSLLPPRFDVFELGYQEDPYPTYAKLRAAGALCRGGPATWAVSRYAQVAALLRDPRLGHAEPPLLGGGIARMMAALQPPSELYNLISGLDAPEHTRVRRLMVKSLTPSMVNRLRYRISTHAGAVLSQAFERGGEVDAVTDLAVPLQLAVAGDLLGIPEVDRAEVMRHAMDLGRAIIMVPFVTPHRGNGDAEARWLRSYVATLLAERRAKPGYDVISGMLAAEHSGQRLTDDEVIDNAVFLLFAGFETSIHVVAGGCAALLAFPDQLTRLRADRSLVPRAVEEILRHDAPLQWISRVPSEAIEIDGRTINPGRVLLLLLGSANHDERQFTDPERLDVGRDPNPHLSFGGGSHHCLGVLLARAQGTLVFTMLLDRCASIRPAGTPVRQLHPNIRGYSSVPIELRPA